MPVMSYLAYPAKEKKMDLANELNRLDSCQAMVSTNRDLVILITDTASDREEEKLQEKLQEMSYLAGLALVSAYGDQF